MGYISNNNLSTTQLHLPFTHCDINGTDEQHHQVITASSGELGDGKNNFPVTSRWNPTPEQIMTLEELYRSGTRTPTTEQIKEIAFKLRKFGRIEGKNVFYWFQNHKARDRQKRRRREGDAINNVHQPQNDFKDSSGGHRVDQTKSCLSIPHSKSKPQPQYELVTVNHEKDNNIIYEDHGTTEESERASEDGKDATWRSLVTWSVTQEQGEINIINENEYNVLKQEEEGTREIRTLNLFPVMESQEKTDRFTENKMHTKANQVLGCNCCYYYEFMPLKN